MVGVVAGERRTNVVPLLYLHVSVQNRSETVQRLYHPYRFEICISLPVNIKTIAFEISSATTYFRQFLADAW